MNRLLVRTALVSVVAATATAVPLSSADAAAPLTISSATIDHVVTQAEPTANLTVDTDHVGHFAVDYHLDPDGGAPSTTEIHAEGETDGAGAFTIPLTTTGLADGAYAVNGTVTVTDGDGDATAALDAAGTVWLVIDRVGPVVTSIDPYVQTIRPGSTTDANTFTLITAYGDAQLDDDFVIFGPGGDQVGVPLTDVSPGTSWTTTWDGHGSGGVLLPRGLYTFKLRDELGNLSGTVAQVRLQRLVSKTFTKTVTATGSRIDTYVGRCSSLKVPSSHGWSGSIGYYANTRCRSTADADTVVLTRHRMVVPSAAKYVDVRVKAYSGHSKGYAGDIGVLVYENAANSDAAAVERLGATLGTHAGPLVTASKVLRSVSGRKFVYWNAGTASFNHYDVKTFTVVVHYKIWQ